MTLKAFSNSLLKSGFLNSVIPISNVRFRENGRWDDDLSMIANNSSTFNYREKTGGGSLSNHAYGRAVDINTVQNPYIKGAILCSLRHILVLGLSTTLTHTVTILLLATIYGGVVSAVADERAHQWIEIGSAFLILLTGAWLLRRAVKRRKSNKDCRDLETSCNCQNHQQTSKENKPISFGIVGLLGTSSGLIPCPTALAVLLSAMTAGHFFGGLWTVCLFSVGLAATLCAVALLAAFVAKSSAKIGFLQRLNLSRWTGAMPLVSAWIITGSGIFMLFRSVFFPEINLPKLLKK